MLLKACALGCLLMFTIGVTALVVGRRKDTEWGKWLDGVNAAWNKSGPCPKG